MLPFLQFLKARTAKQSPLGRLDNLTFSSLLILEHVHFLVKAQVPSTWPLINEIKSYEWILVEKKIKLLTSWTTQLTVLQRLMEDHHLTDATRTNNRWSTRQSRPTNFQQSFYSQVCNVGVCCSRQRPAKCQLGILDAVSFSCSRS